MKCRWEEATANLARDAYYKPAELRITKGKQEDQARNKERNERGK